MLRVICILCRFQHCTSLFLRCVVCVRWLVAHHSSSHTHTHTHIDDDRSGCWCAHSSNARVSPSHREPMFRRCRCAGGAGKPNERTTSTSANNGIFFFGSRSDTFHIVFFFCWFVCRERCYDRPNPMANKYRAKVQRMVIEATPKEWETLSLRLCTQELWLWWAHQARGVPKWRNNTTWIGRLCAIAGVIYLLRIYTVRMEIEWKCAEHTHFTRRFTHNPTMPTLQKCECHSSVSAVGARTSRL